MLLTTTGANHGFARAMPHVFGTGVGICLILVGLGLFGSQLLENGTFRGILKWGGMAYLIWLAYRIGTSRPKAESDDESAKPLGFLQAILFQALNPKVWLGGASGIVAYGAVAGEWTSLSMSLSFAILFSLISMPCGAVWALIGASARHLLRSERALRLFDVTMVLLLLASLVPVALS
ncbi:LysE family translocator [Sinorhizobium fredii]|nr:LysE family translocator [Sinorhizobium fredii]